MIKRLLLAVSLMILSVCQMVAQGLGDAPESKTYELKVKADRFLIMGEDIFYIPNDTTIWVADTVDVLVKKNSLERSEAFYDSLETRMSKSRVSNLVYDLVFNNSKPHKQEDSKLRFTGYEGQRVTKIKYKGLPVLSSRITDTTYYNPNPYTRFFNRTHVHTRDWIIEKNLLFEEGDKVEADKMIDTERLLRRLEFIRQARVMLKNTGNQETEVVVVTRDVFPFNVEIDPSNGNDAVIGLSHINIGGIGHRFEYDHIDWGEYEMFYTVPNIGGAFIDGRIDYSHHFKKTGIGVNFDKEFVTQDVQFGGGLELSSFEFGEISNRQDGTELEEFYYKRRRADFWVGRSFKTNITMPSIGFNKDTYAVIAARRDFQNFYDKPIVTADTNYLYHDRETILMSVGLTSREYYKDKFILNIGRTEDIPTGTALGLTMGMQRREFDDRLYLGAVYARGGYVKGVGYFNSIYSLGSFAGDEGFEDGVLSLEVDYFSPLNQWGQYKFRQFALFSFSQALNPNEDVFIRSQRDLGITGLSGFYLKATTKANVQMQSLLFTPASFLSFRLATFVFFEATAVSNSVNSFFDPSLYYGTGVGVLLRNDNLAISTIQLRLGIYPSLPLNGEPNHLDLSTSPRIGIRDFDFKAPEVISFN